MVARRLVSRLQGMRGGGLSEHRTELARHEGPRGAVLAELEVIKFCVRCDSICNPYSMTTNQEAIRALFRVINRYGAGA